MLTQEEILIDSLFMGDTGLTRVACKLLGGRNSPTLACVDVDNGHYYYEESNALWDYKCEKEMYMTISHLIENFIIKCINSIIITTSDDINEVSNKELLRKKLLKERSNIQKLVNIKNVCQLLRSMTFNKNFKNIINRIPYLLPIKGNLVINLRTGITEPRLKIHYFTRECNVSYGNLPDINGISVNHKEEVKKFFLDIAGGNEDLCKLYQVIFGLFMTGEMPKYIFIFFGKGNNGKSVMMRILDKILGGFYATLNKSIFIEAKGFSSANSHTSYLKGIIESRVGVSGELNENEKLNCAILKSISGSDKIDYRECGSSKSETILSQAKVVLPTNDIPTFPSTASALINRLVITPTPIEFVDVDEILGKNQNYKDIELTHNMEENQEYLNDIFSWFVEGAMIFYKEGLKIPKFVQDFKKQCVLENDVFLQFLNENIIEDKTSDVKVKDLYIRYIEGTSIYNQYLQSGRVNGNKIKTFCDDLRKRNFNLIKIDRAQHISGYMLLKKAEEIEYEKELASNPFNTF